MRNKKIFRGKKGKRSRKKNAGSTVQLTDAGIDRLKSLRTSSGQYTCSDCGQSSLYNVGFPSSQFGLLQSGIDAWRGSNMQEYIDDWNRYDKDNGCTKIGETCTVDGVEYIDWTPRQLTEINPLNNYSRFWTQVPKDGAFENGTYKLAIWGAQDPKTLHVMLIGKSASGKPYIYDPQIFSPFFEKHAGKKLHYLWKGSAPNDFGSNKDGTGIEDYFRYTSWAYKYKFPGETLHESVPNGADSTTEQILTAYHHSKSYTNPPINLRANTKSLWWLQGLKRLDGGGVIKGKLPLIDAVEEQFDILAPPDEPGSGELRREVSRTLGGGRRKRKTKRKRTKRQRKTRRN